MNCHPETFDQLIPDKERLRYALIDIDNLRRCLMQAYKEAEMWKNRVELCPSQGEIAQLKADLAATRALLAEAREVVASKRQFQAGYPLPKHLQITPERADLARRIDTALAEKDAT